MESPKVGGASLPLWRRRPFLATDVTPEYYRVIASNPQGQLLLSFGREGNRVGGFAFPNGIAVQPGGLLYVTDRANDRVQLWGY